VSTTTLPVLDLGAPSDLPRLVAACEGAGAFYLTTSDALARRTANVFALARQLFDLPLEDRMQVARPRGGPLGYVPPDHLRHDVFFAAVYPSSGLPGGVTPSPNLWPARPEGLERAAAAYVESLYDLGRALLRSLALSLDLEPAHLVTLFHPEPCGGLNLRRYLGQARGDAPASLPPHSDPLPFTFIAQTEGEGLEAQLPTGEWVATPHVPGAILCQLGDVMPRWTDDRYRTCTHRVEYAGSAQDRYSVVMSMAPRLDVTIECLAKCRAPGRAPRHPPITVGDLLGGLAGRMKA
jgi:isopenicillin N synthase-like dioxygenase